jgi:hypothetical protein
MSEREITFSQYEKEQIGFHARQFAELGEDAVWELVLAKARLMKLQILFVKAHIKLAVPGSEDLGHEINVIDEVVRQARIIMQFEGKDDLSVLDREAQVVGLGSIFDSDSEIGKRLSDHLYK